MTTHDFTALPDLASRTLGGSVSAANDELFAQRENLIRPELRSSTRTSSVTRERSTTGGNPSPPRQRS
jgi:allantoicase